MMTVPPRKDGQTRYQPVTKSRGWGDKVEREPGDFVPEGTAVLSRAEVAEVVRELGVAEKVAFADPDVQGEPIGWRATPGRSLCLSLLYCCAGDHAPAHPTKLLVLDLACDWLRAIPADIGDGPAVEQVLRRYLWAGPWRVSVDDLRAAHRADVEAAEQRAAEAKARAAWQREAREITASLWEQYRADPVGCPRFFKVLLGVHDRDPGPAG
jgi:hypothetical protein